MKLILELEIDYTPEEDRWPSEMELQHVKFHGKIVQSLERVVDAINWCGDLQVNFDDIRDNLHRELEEIAAQEAIDRAADEADWHYEQIKDRRMFPLLETAQITRRPLTPEGE